MPFSPSGKKERKIAERSVVEAHSRETSLIHINIFLLRIKHSLEHKHRETQVIQERKAREKERKAEIQNTKSLSVDPQKYLGKNVKVIVPLAVPR